MMKMSNKNNNNDYQDNQNIPPELDYDQVFREHKQELQQKHDEKMSMEVQVKSKSQEEIDKEKQEKADQAKIKTALEEVYCICKHHRKYHDLEGYGSCHKKNAKLVKGKMVIMECYCGQFSPLKNQAEVVPTRW